MALNTLKYSLPRVPKVNGIQRSLATQPAVCQDEKPAAADIKNTVLSNKLMVTSLDQGGPLTRVSVAFRVGSRHENPKNLGIVHIIRSLVGFATEKCTGFAVWKNTQQNGVHMYCTGDREVTGIHIVGARDKLKATLKFLGATAATPAFKRWEVKDNANRLLYQVKGLPPQVRVLDNLHAAAFRTGLGNSLFIKSHQIGAYPSTMLEEFYKEAFVSNRAAVSGYNISQNDLVEFAKSLELVTNDIDEGNSTYYGGEIRSEAKTSFSHVAIAAQGVGMKDIKDSLSFSVLQNAYGVRPSISWGGSPSPLYKAVQGISPKAAVNCFNVSYSDNGLFGIIISSYADEIGGALKEGLKILKSGTISEADFKRGKALVQANLLYASENSENLMDDFTQQSLLGGIVFPAPVLAEALEKLTFSDVTKAAKKISSGKLSLSAYGNLTEVPYLSDIQ